MYPDGEYDLAGFCVGVVERDGIIDGRAIAGGDAVLGLASSGAHSNGYSLIRRILERARPDLGADFHGRPLAEVLMAPTRIYVKPVLGLMREARVKGLAHITGGGLLENVPRILPEGVRAALDRDAWPLPPLFRWLQAEAQIPDAELYRVFNCGIGMVAVVAAGDADRATRALQAAGETVYRLGTIEPRPAGAPPVAIR
jgi:phosphoribosylformylglycinamidine cyclo-ligase